MVFLSGIGEYEEFEVVKLIVVVFFFIKGRG